MDYLYYISIGFILTTIISSGIVSFSVKYTKYQVAKLQDDLEKKINLTDDEKMLLEITKDYLEKVK